MIRRIPRIWTHGTQILERNLTETSLQRLRHPQIRRELIRRKLVPPRKDGQRKRQNLVHGCPDRLEEEQHGDNRGDGPRYAIETKGAVEVNRVVTEGKGVEGCRGVQLCNDEITPRMSQFPVSELVAQDGQYFIVAHLFHECIEEYDAFVLAETKHEGVGM